MLRNVAIRNFKCLRDVNVALSPLTVLIGKNDTGKTSFLEALDLLGRLAGEYDDSSVSDSRRLEGLVTHGANPSDITWALYLEATARNGLQGGAHYNLTMRAGGERPYVISEECQAGSSRLTVTADGGAHVLEAHDGDWRCTPGTGHFDRPGLSRLHGERQAPTLRRVARELSSTALYRLDPRRLAQDAPIADDATTIPQIRYDGFGLPSVLDYLLGVARPEFDAIESELRAVVPFIKNVQLRGTKVTLVPGDSAPPHFQPGSVGGKALSFALAPSGSEVRASLVSDGVLLFLAYLTLIHAPNAPSTILLEEPENGLHPSRLEALVRFLRRLTSSERGSKQAQVILATHSPYLLDHVPAESVLVFGRRDDGDTVVKPMAELPEVKKRMSAGLSVGEMWFNLGEDRLLADFLKAG